MKKVFSFIVNLVLVVCIALAAVVMVMVGLNSQKGRVSTVGGFTMMVVQTGSMTPKFPIGCMVIAKKTDAAALKKGDVISFYSSDPDLNGMVVTHRITEVVDNSDGELSFVTKGDANQLTDRFEAQSSNIIGKVIYKSTLLGKIKNIREKPSAFFFALVVPMIAIISYEVISVSKKLKGSKSAGGNDEKESS